jgi:2-haloacid dehalogenase
MRANGRDSLTYSLCMVLHAAPVQLEARGLGTPRAVLFDAYGTLFDVHSVAVMAEQIFPGQGVPLSRAWRDRQIDYTRLVSMAGRYRPFWDLTRAGLQQATAQLGLMLAAVDEERLMDQYRKLASYPEIPGVLDALRARGIQTGILSNGDPAMLAAAVTSAGLADGLDHVISADPLQRYKPDPAVYALGPHATGVAAADTLFVSSNGWDAIGATWFGYRSFWVNRSGAPLDPLGAEPHHRGSSLGDILNLF